MQNSARANRSVCGKRPLERFTSASRSARALEKRVKLAREKLAFGKRHARCFSRLGLSTEGLAREGICGVEGYLALMSAELGVRVELAESDCWSLEADAALEELQEALQRLVGA